MTPGDRKYTRTHEWIKIDGDTAVIGITDHAQKAMGDVTYIDGPAVGLAVEPGGELGVIESVKAASDLYAPVKGTVSEVNAGLEDAPELVNEDPYDRGWIVKLKSVDPAAFDTLMDADAYEAFLTA
jgi:glycine cleavage system H protein